MVDDEQPSGSHQVLWDGRDDAGATAASGVYVYLLEAGGERRTRKLVLLK